MLKKYLCQKEVSALTGLSIPTLQRWVWKRLELPFIKAGRRVLYDLDDINQYMKKNKITPR